MAVFIYKSSFGLTLYEPCLIQIMSLAGIKVITSPTTLDHVHVSAVQLV